MHNPNISIDQVINLLQQAANNFKRFHWHSISEQNKDEFSSPQIHVYTKKN